MQESRHKNQDWRSTIFCELSCVNAFANDLSAKVNPNDSQHHSSEEKMKHSEILIYDLVLLQQFET